MDILLNLPTAIRDSFTNLGRGHAKQAHAAAPTKQYLATNASCNPPEHQKIKTEPKSILVRECEQALPRKAREAAAGAGATAGAAGAGPSAGTRSKRRLSDDYVQRQEQERQQQEQRGEQQQEQQQVPPPP